MAVPAPRVTSRQPAAGAAARGARGGSSMLVTHAGPQQAVAWSEALQSVVGGWAGHWKGACQPPGPAVGRTAAATPSLTKLRAGTRFNSHRQHYTTHACPSDAGVRGALIITAAAPAALSLSCQQCQGHRGFFCARHGLAGQLFQLHKGVQAQAEGRGAGLQRRHLRLRCQAQRAVSSQRGERAGGGIALSVASCAHGARSQAAPCHAAPPHRVPRHTPRLRRRRTWRRSRPWAA